MRARSRPLAVGSHASLLLVNVLESNREVGRIICVYVEIRSDVDR